MNVLQPFLAVVEEAVQRIKSATDYSQLEYERTDMGGVLRGYYFAGVVSKVEYEAAVRSLQFEYETCMGRISPDFKPQRRLFG